MTVLAEVHAYDGILIFVVLEKGAHPGIVSPYNRESVFGTVILDTAEHLGVSEDALQLLRKIEGNPRTSGSLGDIDWFNDPQSGKSSFSWIGGETVMVPEQLEPPSTYKVRDGEFRMVKNAPPEGAILYINELRKASKE